MQFGIVQVNQARNILTEVTAKVRKLPKNSSRLTYGEGYIIQCAVCLRLASLNNDPGKFLYSEEVKLLMKEKGITNDRKLSRVVGVNSPWQELLDSLN